MSLSSVSALNIERKTESTSHHTNPWPVLATLAVMLGVSASMLSSWPGGLDPLEIAEVVPYSQREDVAWTPKPPRSALSERWDYFWHQRRRDPDRSRYQGAADGGRRLSGGERARSGGFRVPGAVLPLPDRKAPGSESTLAPACRGGWIPSLSG